MKKGLISIIVPVYNADKYLDVCISSILNQTYKKYEVILVNDGSKDNSLIICEKYKNKDKRVFLFSKDNGGVSSARNMGLSKASGEFVCFIDSDDFVSKEFLKILIDNINETNSDISVCGIEKTSRNEHKDEIGNIKTNKYSVFNKLDSYEEMIHNSQFAGYSCNKLYRMSLIKKMNYLFKGFMIEDFEFNSRLLNYCKKTVFTPTKLYYYYVNNDSATKTFAISDRVFSGFDSYKSILHEYDKNNVVSSDLVAYHYLKYYYNVNYRAKKSKYNFSKKYYDNDIYKRVIKSPLIKKKDKIILLLTNKFPFLCYSLKELIKKKVK